MESASILIVEDEVTIARYLETLLVDLGYKITDKVNNGEDAIRSAKECRPDLVLMDIRIKGEMDGIEAAEAIQSLQNIPVIFVTAFAEEERSKFSRMKMPFGYLLKPVKKKDLEVSIEMALYAAKADARRKAVEEKLVTSEEINRAVVEHSDDAIVMVDENGEVVLLNYAAAQYLGGSPEDYRGRQVRSVLSDIIENDRIDEYKQMIKARRFGRQNIEFHFEDEIRIFDSSINPVKIRNQTVWLSILRDITEEKHAERQIRESLKEKEVLLQEVHHRVKNNLQVISSLIGMQILRSRNEELKDVLGDFQNRIRAMALVHEKIFKSSDYSRIKLSLYIKNLVLSLVETLEAETSAIDFFFDIEPVEFDLGRAVCIGLIVTELFTNAVKYAFRKTGGGQISIRFRTDEKDCSTLVFTDNGDGLPEGFDAETSRSLGMKIVRMFADQLHADMDITVNGGTQFVFKFAL